MRGEGSVLYDVHALSRAVGELLDDGLADAPLNATEYAVYSFIFERDSVTPSEVSHALSMPRQTVSDWVALLRTRGLGLWQLARLGLTEYRAARRPRRHHERVGRPRERRGGRHRHRVHRRRRPAGRGGGDRPGAAERPRR